MPRVDLSIYKIAQKLAFVRRLRYTEEKAEGKVKGGSGRRHWMEAFDSVSIPLYRSAGLGERGVCINIAGCYAQVHTHRLPPRRVKDWILILCTAGGGWVRTDQGPRIPVKPGQIFFIPPDTLHSYGNGPEGWSILWLHCTGSAAELLCRRICDRRPAGTPFWAGYAEGGFQQLWQRLQDQQGIADLLYAEALLTQLLCDVLAGVLDTTMGNRAKATVQLAVNLLQTTDDYTLSLDQLADRLGLSKYYFIRVFRQYTGSTPMEYLQQVRLRRACQLLSTTGLTVAQISDRLDYSSPFHFSSAFKRCFGISPSDYRRYLCSGQPMDLEPQPAENDDLPPDETADE